MILSEDALPPGYRESDIAYVSAEVWEGPVVFRWDFEQGCVVYDQPIKSWPGFVMPGEPIDPATVMSTMTLQTD